MLLELEVHYPPKRRGLQDFLFTFYVFESLLCSQSLNVFTLKYSKNSNIVKYVITI